MGQEKITARCFHCTGGGWNYQNWVGKFTMPGVRRCWQIQSPRRDRGRDHDGTHRAARRQMKGEEERGRQVRGEQTSDPEAPGSAGDPGSGGGTEEAAPASPRARWWPERGGAARSRRQGASPMRSLNP